MEEAKIRKFTLDSDSLTVTYQWDPASGKYLGNYPDFDQIPRYSPHGYRWVDVTMPCVCNRGKTECGNCPYMLKEEPDDLIGICLFQK